MSEKSQCEALAQSIVEQFPEEAIKDVIKQARGEDVSTQEQFENVFSSGLFEGARLAYISMVPASQELERLLKNTLDECDKALQLTDDTDAQLAIAGIRRPVALFLQEQNKRMKEVVANALSELCGVAPEQILDSTPTSEYREDDMVMLGLKLSIGVPKAFAAYILWADDPDMPCKCPGHMKERWEAENPDTERVKAEAMRKFPTTNRALASFARYQIEMARRVLAKENDHFDVSELSPKEADDMARQVIDKITGRGHD